jgi:hypothetical protein
VQLQDGEASMPGVAAAGADAAVLQHLVVELQPGAR